MLGVGAGQCLCVLLRVCIRPVNLRYRRGLQVSGHKPGSILSSVVWCWCVAWVAGVCEVLNVLFFGVLKCWYFVLTV